MFKKIDRDDITMILSYFLPGISIALGYFYTPDFPFLLLLFVVKVPVKTANPNSMSTAE